MPYFPSLSREDVQRALTHTYYLGVISIRPPSHAFLESKRRDQTLSPQERQKYALELSKEEFQKFLPGLKHIPVLFKHWDNLDDGDSPLAHYQRRTLGEVTEAYMDQEGTVYVELRPYNDVWGEWMVLNIEGGHAFGLSLQHRRDPKTGMCVCMLIPHMHTKTGYILFIEVSLCYVGRRDGTGVLRTFESLDKELPPLPGRAVPFFHPTFAVPRNGNFLIELSNSSKASLLSFNHHTQMAETKETPVSKEAAKDDSSLTKILDDVKALRAKCAADSPDIPVFDALIKKYEVTPAALTPGRRWASALNSLATKANADPEADGDVKELLALIGKFDSLQQEKDAQANKAKEDVEAKFYQMIDQMNALNPDQAKRVAPPAKELFKGSGDLVSKQSLVEAGYEIISQLTAAAIAAKAEGAPDAKGAKRKRTVVDLYEDNVQSSMIKASKMSGDDATAKEAAKDTKKPDILEDLKKKLAAADKK